MDVDDIKRINSLWSKIYPNLASHIMESYGRTSGAVLELGPFSGGISFELARLYSSLDITIGDETPGMLEYFNQEIKNCGLSERIAIKETDLNRLAFDNSQFDLVIFRGVFFFLDERKDLLREIYRVLKDGGMAFVGGGYGKGIPQELIDEIAEESRELNDRLGRRRFSIKEMEEIVAKSQLGGTCRIEDEGGVWIVIEK